MLHTNGDKDRFKIGSIKPEHEISTEAQQRVDKFWYTSEWFLASLALIPAYYDGLSYLWYYFFAKP
jgi:hypothetical protein